MRLELEELVNNDFVFYRVEDVSGEGDHVLQGLVQVVALQAQLQLTDVLASNSLIVKGKELCSDGHRVDVTETHGEEHLTVAVKLLQHVRVAVFEYKEEFLDAFEHKFLRL